MRYGQLIKLNNDLLLGNDIGQVGRRKTEDRSRKRCPEPVEGSEVLH
jgi:hypothetical protein